MNPKVFIITGTRKGIGSYLATYFLKEGHIVCGCSRGESSIEHKNYRHFALDVSDENAVITMIRNVKREFGNIDILLNNAGIASMNHILTTPFKSLKDIFATNFFGSFLFMREVSKVMIKNKNKHNRIVNFTTIAAPLRLEGESVYAASKAAIANFTQTCAKELATFNITINAIGPTPIATDLIKNVPKSKLDSLLDKQAIKRFGEFEDVLNVIRFFIDEKSDFITGQIIYLGGINE
ncbi:oxidoreductase [Helicobacter sp. 16-1353]|uniref:SDR family NAD(P)-dependent oxidoreductase n=1 Tax=Helicobacter sp. 16-1353 TaxID=2004996 RepID=UPI000DCE2DA4|nr:SDR family oxidoreductase [Helicobacter sp. 16-1353]RAX51427.1 oxidoreductase [Helicobacter sp. 16-1353]